MRPELLVGAHMSDRRVLIAGAGPVGITLALVLAKHNVPVVLFESGATLNASSQASTFHASTLDLLDELDMAWPLIETGNPSQRLQYRDRKEGLLAEFNFSLIRDMTRFPIRLQTDQSQLTRLILDRIRRDHPTVDIRFSHSVVGARNEPGTAVFTVDTPRGIEEWTGSVGVGADGAHSEVRHALGIDFEGSLYQLRHLMITLSYDVLERMPELAPVTYVFDDEETVALLTLRNVWRIVFMVPDDESDETALSPDRLQQRLKGFLQYNSTAYPVVDARIARLHQRVASRFYDASIALAGDAAHLNHPLGGMGLNSGIHDACVLGQHIVRMMAGAGGSELLAEYAAQRRKVMLEKVIPIADSYQKQSEERDPAQRRRRNQELRAIAADPRRARDWLIEASMFSSAPPPSILRQEGIAVAAR
jgi:3-(3-hydroxy-phenyl)propionate hydroxylase